MSMKSVPYVVALPPPQRQRQLAVVAVRGAMRALGRLQRHLRRLPQRPAGDPVLEFYAEAGALEGALYVDGRLVGRVEGVSRL